MIKSSTNRKVKHHVKLLCGPMASAPTSRHERIDLQSNARLHHVDMHQLDNVFSK